MASPQLENGYLRLSNELAEAFARTPLSGSEFRIVLVVYRECYGRNGGQKLAPLTLWRLAKLTSLNLRTVQRETRRLMAAGILVGQNGVGQDCLYGPGKDYEAWDLAKLKPLQVNAPAEVNSPPEVNRPGLPAVSSPGLPEVNSPPP
jgi:phage replication O-like protein O